MGIDRSFFEAPNLVIPRAIIRFLNSRRTILNWKAVLSFNSTYATKQISLDQNKHVTMQVSKL